MIFYRLSILTLLVFISNINYAQKIKEVEIISFKEPFNTITVATDGSNYEYQITKDTKLNSSRSGNLPPRYYKAGSYIDIDYKIENRTRIAKKIKLLSDYTPGKEKFSGVLEYYEGDVAYIDGRRVTLDGNSKLECSGKAECGCKKGMQYLGYNELKIGDFLTVQGNSNLDGDIVAKEIKVCENTYSDTDKKLRSNIDNCLYLNNITSVVAPPGIDIPRNSLHRGNLKIGIMEYDLHDDIQLQGYVNIVGNKVLPHYAKNESYKEDNQIFFRFYVINNEIPNAFAFPNGMVFIHTGLLKILENEAQLASILGREIAHVTYEHAAQRSKTNRYVNSKLVESGKKKIFEKLFSNTDDDDIGGAILTTIGEAAEATKPSDLANLFHKDDEIQADRVGLYYAFEAGYNTREAANFWKQMAKKTKSQNYQSSLSKSVEDMFLDIDLNVNGKNIKELAAESSRSLIDNFLNTVYTSHPNCINRIRAINDLVNTVYQDEESGQKVGEEAFKKRTAKL